MQLSVAIFNFDGGTHDGGPPISTSPDHNVYSTHGASLIWPPYDGSNRNSTCVPGRFWLNLVALRLVASDVSGDE